MNVLRRGPLVLMYHAVGARGALEDPFCLFVPQDRLHEQLATLLARGWTPLTLDTYLHGARPPRSLLVTFDDGYRSVLDKGLPVLRELQVPATVFVLGGLLGGTSRWMAEMPDEPLLDAEGVRENLITSLQRVDERSEAEEEAETMALISDPTHMQMSEMELVRALQSDRDGGQEERY